MGKIHSIENFGTVDGPGVRMVVFFQGCPMRCKYCHNPDTWDYNGGTEMSVKEIINKFENKRPYYKDGGITVSGGEPMVQIDFLIDLFTAAKEKNIHTCLDTSGIFFDEKNEKIVKLLEITDLILLDIKHINNKEHGKLTGFDNTKVLNFAKYLSKINKPVWIRHVLVPEITLKEQYLNELNLFLNKLMNVQKIELLPYHNFGIEKYKKMGLKYPLENIKPPEKKDVELATKILINKGD